MAIKINSVPRDLIRILREMIQEILGHELWMIRLKNFHAFVVVIVGIVLPATTESEHLSREVCTLSGFEIS